MWITWRSLQLESETLTRLHIWNPCPQDHANHVQVARRFRKHHRQTSPTTGFASSFPMDDMNSSIDSCMPIAGSTPIVLEIDLKLPIFGNEIPKNSLHLAVKSAKITTILQNPPSFAMKSRKKKHKLCPLPTLSSTHFFAPNPPMPGRESSWLPAETAEAPVDQLLLPSLCESWANLGIF